VLCLGHPRQNAGMDASGVSRRFSRAPSPRDGAGPSCASNWAHRGGLATRALQARGRPGAAGAVVQSRSIRRRAWSRAATIRALEVVTRRTTVVVRRGDGPLAGDELAASSRSW